MRLHTKLDPEIMSESNRLRSVDLARNASIILLKIKGALCREGSKPKSPR
jgi:hypothetical protein